MIDNLVASKDPNEELRQVAILLLSPVAKEGTPEKQIKEYVCCTTLESLLFFVPGWLKNEDGFG